MYFILLQYSACKTLHTHIHTHTTHIIPAMWHWTLLSLSSGVHVTLFELGQSDVPASANRVWQKWCQMVLRLSHKNNMHFHLVSCDIHFWNPTTMQWEHLSHRKATCRCSSWQSRLKSQPRAITNTRHKSKQASDDSSPQLWSHLSSSSHPSKIHVGEEPCPNHRFKGGINECYFKALNLGVICSAAIHDWNRCGVASCGPGSPVVPTIKRKPSHNQEGGSIENSEAQHPSNCAAS